MMEEVMAKGVGLGKWDSGEEGARTLLQLPSTAALWRFVLNEVGEMAKVAKAKHKPSHADVCHTLQRMYPSLGPGQSPQPVTHDK